MSSFVPFLLKKKYPTINPDELCYILVVKTGQNVVIGFTTPPKHIIQCDTIQFKSISTGPETRVSFYNRYGTEFDATNAFLYDLLDDADAADVEKLTVASNAMVAASVVGGAAAAVPASGSGLGLGSEWGSSARIAAAAGAAAAAAAASKYEDPRAKMDRILSEYRTPMGPLKLLGEKRAGYYSTPGWVDLTHLPSTCTIDDESSEDLDDAISIEETAAGVMLYVHIVDIAHEDLSRELMQRQQEYCSSMYLPGHIEHLLDADTVRRLSLVRGVVRTAITVKLRFGGGAEPCEIFKSLIRVKARLSYTDLRAAIDGGGGAAAASGGAGGGGSSSAIPRATAASSLSLGSVASSCLAPIVRYLLPIAQQNLQPREDIAYKVVAVAMERANKKVAAYLEEKFLRVPFLIGSGKYSLEAKPHPDMGLYIHFTSPLRRYADVLVHRILAGYTAISELEAQVTHINERMALIKQLDTEGKGK